MKRVTNLNWVLVLFLIIFAYFPVINAYYVDPDDKNPTNQYQYIDSTDPNKSIIEPPKYTDPKDPTNYNPLSSLNGVKSNQGNITLYSSDGSVTISSEYYNSKINLKTTPFDINSVGGITWSQLNQIIPWDDSNLASLSFNKLIGAFPPDCPVNQFAYSFTSIAMNCLDFGVENLTGAGDLIEPGSGNLTIIGGANKLFGTADLSIDTIQDIKTTSQPTFSGITLLSYLGNPGFVHTDNILFNGTISGGDFNYSLADANNSQSCGAGQALSSVGNSTSCIAVSAASTDLNWFALNNVLPWADINVADNITNNNDVDKNGDTWTGDMNTHTLFPFTTGGGNLGSATNRYGFVLATHLGSPGTKVTDIWTTDINSSGLATFGKIKFNGTISGGDFNYSLSDANASQAASAGSALSSVGVTVTSIYVPNEADIDANALGIVNGLDLNNSLSYSKTDTNCFTSGCDLNWVALNKVIPWQDTNVADDITANKYLANAYLSNLFPVPDANVADNITATSYLANAYLGNLFPVPDSNVANDLTINTTKDANFKNISFTGTASGGDWNFSLADANMSQSCSPGDFLTSVGATTSCATPSSTGVTWTQIGAIMPLGDVNVANTITVNSSGFVWDTNAVLDARYLEQAGDTATGPIKFDGNAWLGTGKGLLLGDNNQAQIRYDGTNLVVTPNVSGTGITDHNGSDIRVKGIGVNNQLSNANVIINGGIAGTTSTFRTFMQFQGTYIGASSATAANIGNDYNGTANPMTAAGGVFFARAQHNATGSSTTLGTSGTAGLVPQSNINFTLGNWVHDGVKAIILGTDSNTFINGGHHLIRAFYQVAVGDFNNFGTIFGALFNNDVQFNSDVNVIFDGPNDTNKGDTKISYIGAQSNLVLNVDANKNTTFDNNGNVVFVKTIFTQDTNTQGTIHGMVWGTQVLAGVTCDTGCTGGNGHPNGSIWTCIFADSLAGIASTCGDVTIAKACMCQN